VGFASNTTCILGHCQYNIDTFLNVEENTKISKHICSPSWKLLWFTIIHVYVTKNGGSGLIWSTHVAPHFCIRIAISCVIFHGWLAVVELVKKGWKTYNRVICKIRKTQHQNPESGLTQGEIQKKVQKSTLAFKGGGGGVHKTIKFGSKLSFIPSFLFPERGDCCYIYFHCS
jgi:hypothetical protein